MTIKINCSVFTRYPPGYLAVVIYAGIEIIVTSGYLFDFILHCSGGDWGCKECRY
jgi:hypothetical protein